MLDRIKLFFTQWPTTLLGGEIELHGKPYHGSHGMAIADYAIPMSVTTTIGNMTEEELDAHIDARVQTALDKWYANELL